MMDLNDEYAGLGGSYVIQGGKRVLVERTQDGPLPAEETAVAPEQSPATQTETTEGGNE